MSLVPDHPSLFRLCWDVVKGDLKPDSAVKHFQETEKNGNRVGPALLDILQTIDVDVSVKDNAEQKDRLRKFCNEISGKVLEEDVIRFNLESFNDRDVSSRVIKARTKAFYKQKKYNLLREESEGYSKLITELSQEKSEAELDTKQALERVKCLIGQFNLDPNRVLDVILECFERRLGEYEFFVDLLKLYGSTKEDICSIMGFKFTFHQARFKSKADVPDSLYILAAILLHSNLIDLLPFCAFLTPDTQWIVDHTRRQTAEAVTRGKKAQQSTSTLADAGGDSSASQNQSLSGLLNSQPPMNMNSPAAGNQVVSNMSSDFGKSIPFEVEDFDEGCNIGENQKLGLLWGLIEIGSWNYARHIFIRLPEYYAVRSSKIALALIRLVHRLLHDFYLKKCPVYSTFLDTSFPESPVIKAAQQAKSRSGSHEGRGGEGGTPNRGRPSSSQKRSSTVPGSKLSKSGTSNETKSARKGASGSEQSEEDSEPPFLGEFPEIESWDELATVTFPVLSFLGPYLGYDSVVLTKMIRILTEFMSERDVLLKRKDASTAAAEEDSSSSVQMTELEASNLAVMEKIYPMVVDVCDEVLLPAMSIMDQNCCASEDMWGILLHLPYRTRYRLYWKWKNVHTKSHPIITVKKALIEGRAKYVMKRLSKETIKLIGRQLGKMSHTHPGVVFDYILTQIQTFENLIGPVVDSLRYLTSLEFDILTYCIIENLASPDKQRLKVSDGTISPWLQSLGNFVGTVYKKHSMELTGVLQYVANQLKAGHSFDLLVLREIVQNMSGVETTSGLTPEQLEAWAGGELLKQEGGYFGTIKNIRKTSNRLKEALFQDDLGVALCILMGQQRSSIVFKEGDGIHLKLVGQMLDQCQETLVQFGSFLQSSLKSDDYNRRMPSGPDLIKQYHVPNDVAMFLSRPVYISRITTKYDELKKQEKAAKSLHPEKKAAIYRHAATTVVDPLAEEIRPLLPAPVWKAISPQLYSVFWILSMYDLHLPAASYDREIDKLEASIKALEESREASSKIRKDKDRIQSTISKLTDEKKKQTDLVERTVSYIREQASWIPQIDSEKQKGEQANQFFRLCLLPRSILTDVDAVYCAQFILIMHSSKVPNFQTLRILERFLGDLTPMLTSLSENEANFYGRFLASVLEYVYRWHNDKTAFEKECQGFPGFSVIVKTGEDTTAPFTFESFRKAVHSWHNKMTKSLFVGFISKNYITIRNSLIILLKILPYYPLTKSVLTLLDNKVNSVKDQEKEQRQDLHVLAASCWGMLKKRNVPLLPEDQFTAKSAPNKKSSVKASVKGSGGSGTSSPSVVKKSAVQAAANAAAASACKSSALNGPALPPSTGDGKSPASPAKTKLARKVANATAPATTTDSHLEKTIENALKSGQQDLKRILAEKGSSSPASGPVAKKAAVTKSVAPLKSAATDSSKSSQPTVSKAKEKEAVTQKSAAVAPKPVKLKRGEESRRRESTDDRVAKDDVPSRSNEHKRSLSEERASSRTDRRDRSSSRSDRIARDEPKAAAENGSKRLKTEHDKEVKSETGESNSESKDSERPVNSSKPKSKSHKSSKKSSREVKKPRLEKASKACEETPVKNETKEPSKDHVRNEKPENPRNSHGHSVESVKKDKEAKDFPRTEKESSSSSSSKAESKHPVKESSVRKERESSKESSSSARKETSVSSSKKEQPLKNQKIERLKKGATRAKEQTPTRQVCLPHSGSSSSRKTPPHGSSSHKAHQEASTHAAVQATEQGGPVVKRKMNVRAAPTSTEGGPAPKSSPAPTTAASPGSRKSGVAESPTPPKKVKESPPPSTLAARRESANSAQRKVSTASSSGTAEAVPTRKRAAPADPKQERVVTAAPVGAASNGRKNTTALSSPAAFLAGNGRSDDAKRIRVEERKTMESPLPPSSPSPSGTREGRHSSHRKGESRSSSKEARMAERDRSESNERTVFVPEKHERTHHSGKKRRGKEEGRLDEEVVESRKRSKTKPSPSPHHYSESPKERPKRSSKRRE